MKTKVNLNRPGSPSLKSTIPQGVVSALKLQNGDEVEWNIEAKGSEMFAVIKKIE